MFVFVWNQNETLKILWERKFWWKLTEFLEKQKHSRFDFINITRGLQHQYILHNKKKKLRQTHILELKIWKMSQKDKWTMLELLFFMTKLPREMYRIRSKGGTSDFTQLKVNWPLSRLYQPTDPIASHFLCCCYKVTPLCNNSAKDTRITIQQY